VAGPLAGLLVVELGDGTAAPYAAKLFADFGAEIIKVETGEGDSTRQRGPFPGECADSEASGLFFYLNTNKRGVVLDLDDKSGCAALERLLDIADVFVTNMAPARLAAAGFAPNALRERHPGLIITSITPFGTDGRWASRRADELVTYAMGGMAYSTPGMPDAALDLEAEPPLHPACFAAETISGVVAAVAMLAALHARSRSRVGCLVEVSQQAAVASMQHRDINNVSYGVSTYKHSRIFSTTTTGRMPNFYLPCKDGFVAVPAPLESHWAGLVEAMGNPQWARSPQFASGAARTANAMELHRRLREWTKTVTGDELYELAERHQLLLFPFYTVRKMLESEHVIARESVVRVEIGGRPARMPGAPIKMQRTPWTLRRMAPRRGEHTAQVLNDLVTGDARRACGTATTASPAAKQEQKSLPLAGVRVLDLGQFIAIPFCTLWLAWLGAEVISIESRRRMTSRTAPPFAPGHPGDPDASGYYNLLYSSKKSCTVDMTKPAGRDLVLRLAAKVDVMVDNYSSGVLEKLGLDYGSVNRVNPRIIAVSCGAFGRSGPLKNARGLHSAVNLFSGVADVTGYPGGGPRILGGVLPDPLAGMYASFAVMAALRHRERSGKGQLVDIAMYEAMMSLIPEAVIDLTLRGREPTRIGNRDRVKAPHGVYRCSEFDTWVAVSVGSEEEWQALCRACGHPDWLADARFSDAGARRANVVALEEALEGWTRTLSREQATETLQAHGVGAGPVLRTDELLDDERLQQLGAVITTEHPIAGARRQLGLPWRMDSARADYGRAPLLGEHTREILTNVLGMSESEYLRLNADGVLA
jgi:crotonobetainyl-CoA:carnitine CoA-transferase CaiB-like acyl-CoA transferase